MPEIINPPPGATSGDLVAANNLSDVASAANARANLGVTELIEEQNELRTNQRNTLNPLTRGRVVSDGQTTHRAVRYLPREVGAISGLPITIFGIVPVLATNPPARVQIHAITDNAGNSSLQTAQRNHTLHFYYDTNGDLIVRQIGAVFNDRRAKVYSDFLGAYSAFDYVRVALCFPNPDTTDDFELWVEGTDIVPSMTDDNANTVPNWVPPTMDTTWNLTGYEWPAVDMPEMSLVLGAFSSAEAEAYTSGGRVPAWAEQAGSAKAILTNGFSSSDGWNLESDLAITGGELQFTANGSNRNVWRTDSSLDDYVGVPLLITWTADGPGRLALTYAGDAWTDYGVDDIIWDAAGVVAVVAAPTTEVLTRYGFRFKSAGGSVNIDNFQIYHAGSIFRPYFQPGFVVGDQTGRISAFARGCNQTPEPGVRDISIDLPFNYTGSSIQVLGGDVLGGMDARIVSVSGYSDGNTTGSLGTSSGGTQLVNAQTINGDFDIATFASRIISAGTSLYWTPGANPTAGTLHIVLRPINQGA